MNLPNKGAISMGHRGGACTCDCGLRIKRPTASKVVQLAAPSRTVVSVNATKWEIKTLCIVNSLWFPKWTSIFEAVTLQYVYLSAFRQEGRGIIDGRVTWHYSVHCQWKIRSPATTWLGLRQTEHSFYKYFFLPMIWVLCAIIICK